ncbi:Rpn family recombination-promoting nuclease/putative transposase [Yersinia enterocolitica]|uniref:Rpn family recombination-promoting nuclease/putative transposase n=1 Tax=Yersinia hibernica TaxID=2339259 RepID=A0ABX5R840_9GAMM|nr:MULTISPECIES: Rpn family recombination-promoting nuclease/putative transposase [Yersinia]EKN4883142.1 Rpn family recombination-promoting nuclease/putative transposase [Yersinia enterocolitica]EKN6092324.1 Rpn family recombination-promoting nuclease/putative transposase [Yersinia enterocolitica]EKN6127845.1 Rpn family recombination-promoting nuclease/putative transposase [Yersinia enterocolitica]ELI8480484.1 Rpn family recombination-promoting nuclease/putative transposase [Yersinia enterocoli
MKTTPTPHDALFKQFLTHPETARDFLEVHLPPALRQACDLSTLRLESGSFIEEDLRAYYSDVLYSLKAGQGDGYIYALIEHQSSPDKHMGFRMMRYAIAAMQRHLDAGNDKLPLVIPILFYHGQVTPYPYPMSWLQEFSEPELAEQLYSNDFPLVDVTVISDDEIMTHRRMAILELLQKHVRQRDLAELMEQLVTLLLAGYTNNEQLTSLMNYMLQVGDTAAPENFIRELARRSPQHEEVLMTIAQKLEQKGIEKGRQEGRLEGRQEGVFEGKLEVARSMLASGLDRTMVMKMTGLSADDLAQIRH